VQSPSPTIRDPSGSFQPHYHLEPTVEARLRRIERLDHDLSQLHAGDEGHAMLRAALSYNAYGTASIEGNPLTLPEVQSVLARGPIPEAMRTPDEREILNWAAFMQSLDDHEVPRNVRDVEKIHARLFEGVMAPEQGLGRLKERANYIGRRDGTVIYVPTPPERTPTELQAALDWYHGCTDPPLIRAWLFHVEFEAIHPFSDGNGRLGRALMTLMLHRSGYPGVRHALVDYCVNTERESYYEALKAAQKHPEELTPWLGYLSEVFENAYSDAVARLVLGRDARLNPRQAQLAAWLLRVCKNDRRVAFGDVHAAFPYINRRTLQQDLRRLVDSRLLDLRGVRRGATYGLRRQDSQ
jgi:Fic family protein